MKMFNILTSAAFVGGMLAAPLVSAASDTDMKGVQAAQVSLGEAIQAAQKSGNGKAIYGKYATRNGAGAYEVVVVSGGKTNTLDVDPTTGEAVKAKRDDSDKTEKNGAQTIESAQIGLSDAIMTAEKQGGRALEAQLDTKEGTTTYEVEVANGDKTNTVWIDVNSGQIVKKS